MYNIAIMSNKWTGCVLFVSVFLCADGHLDLPEGSKCMMGDHEGVCVDWHKCLTFIVDRVRKQYPPVCSYRAKDPIICCTSCELVANVSNAVISHNGEILWKTGQKAWDKCIDYFTDLTYEESHIPARYKIKKTWNATNQCHEIDWNIIPLPLPSGGIDANRGDYPHMALLGYGENLDTALWLCGGSLISEKFILTAGHCISSPALGPVAFVGLGMLKRSDPLEYWSRYTVKRIIPHPKYKAPSKYHDIALLETNEIMEFVGDKLPACLPKNFENYEDENATATGWGALGYKAALADNLQVVELQKFNQEQCATMYPPHRHLTAGYDHANQMCYGDMSRPRDTCEGDSGGPLQLQNPLARLRLFTIIGVTSYGLACGFAGNAGMYTRVSSYVPWIESIIWP